MAQKDDAKAFSEGQWLSCEVVRVYVAVCGAVVHSYHLTNHAVEAAISGIGIMGIDGKIECRLALRFSDGKYTFLPEFFTISDTAETEAELRKRALSKLTPAEKIALLGKRG